MSVPDLRSFLQILEKEKELCTITAEVDSELEIAEIHRRVVAANGPALLFTNVKGSQFPITTNLFGSEKRMELAFPDKPERCIQAMIDLLTGHFPPTLSELWKNRTHVHRLLRSGTKKIKKAPITECELTDLEQLPILQCWPDDGGHFITLPLVYTEPVGHGAPNLGMYRIQRFDKKTTGLHFQIAKGGGFHLAQAEALNQVLPVSIFLGGPPALMLSAIAPLPENVPELLFASLLLGKKLVTTRVEEHAHPLIAHAEFAILGEARPHERRIEGPFGDHYGYYGLAHPFPVFHCQKIYHRKNAIYPATVVGKPIQEDLFIGHYLQRLLSPLISVVIPAIQSLWSYGETGFHPLAAAIVKERYEKEALTTAFRIFGEGQLSLTKFLIITDQPIDLSDIKCLLETVLERFRPEVDLYIFSNTSNDTLDYTGPKLNHGSKALLLGLGPKKRVLPSQFIGTLPRPISAVRPFCKGCLVLQAPSYTAFRDIAHLTQHHDFSNWPLLVLVDDLESSCSSTLEFLWSIFTRFDPAGDIFSAAMHVERHHITYTIPLLIDARTKPSYPKEAIADTKTQQLVDNRWKEYCINV